MIRHPQSRPITQRAVAWATNLWPVRQILAPIFRKQTAAKARPEHYPAPFALIEVWRRGGSSISQRLKLEARSMAETCTDAGLPKSDPRVLSSGASQAASAAMAIPVSAVSM